MLFILWVWNLSHYFFERNIVRLFTFFFVVRCCLWVKQNATIINIIITGVFMIIRHFESMHVHMHFQSRDKSEKYTYVQMRIYLHFDRTLFVLLIHCAFRFRWNFNTPKWKKTVFFLNIFSILMPKILSVSIDDSLSHHYFWRWIC